MCIPLIFVLALLFSCFLCFVFCVLCFVFCVFYFWAFSFVFGLVRPSAFVRPALFTFLSACLTAFLPAHRRREHVCDGLRLLGWRLACVALRVARSTDCRVASVDLLYLHTSGRASSRHHRSSHWCMVCQAVDRGGVRIERPGRGRGGGVSRGASVVAIP